MGKVKFNIQTENKFLNRIDSKTFKIYKSWYERLLDYSGNDLLHSIKFKEIVGFFEYLQKQNYSPSTLHIAYVAIRMLYLDIYKINYRFDKIKLPRIEREIPISISKNDLRNLFDSIDNLKHKTILSLMYAAGLDISEVINLMVSDISNGILSVRNNKGTIIRKTKLGIYMIDLLREYYKAHKPKKYLFEGFKMGKKYSISSIRNIFNKAKKKVKINNEITPRHLKYSYVKHLQDEGFKTSDILKHLNHFNLHAIIYYSQIDNEINSIDYSPIDSIYGKKRPESIKFEVTNEQLENIVFTDSQTKQLIENNPMLIKTFIENDVSHTDIVALGFRKKQLEIFKKLLYDEEFFNNQKKEKGITKDESLWQAFFEANPWIFGHGLNYIFSTPLKNKKLEQVVSGFNFNNSGKRIDGLLKTKGLISSLCFVEIKTHKTNLVKANYYRKESWSISNELTGAIAQIQRSVDKAIKTISSKIEIKDNEGNLTGEKVFLYQPKSYLIIGTLSKFMTEFGVNEEKYSSFEMFRRNIFNPEILTYDELYERAKFIVINNG